MPAVRPRKDITLPVSQETFTIRRLSNWDLMEGGMPDPMRALQLKQMQKIEPSLEDKLRVGMDPDVQRYQARMALAAIMQAPEGMQLVIKDPKECTGAEFAWVDLDPQDQQHLIRQVFDFIQEGAAEAATFP
jgi:hypothetical protein